MRTNREVGNQTAYRVDLPAQLHAKQKWNRKKCGLGYCLCLSLFLVTWQTAAKPLPISKSEKYLWLPSPYELSSLPPSIFHQQEPAFWALGLSFPQWIFLCVKYRYAYIFSYSELKRTPFSLLLALLCLPWKSGKSEKALYKILMTQKQTRNSNLHMNHLPIVKMQALIQPLGVGGGLGLCISIKLQGENTEISNNVDHTLRNQGRGEAFLRMSADPKSGSVGVERLAKEQIRGAPLQTSSVRLRLTNWESIN